MQSFSIRAAIILLVLVASTAFVGAQSNDEDAVPVSQGGEVKPYLVAKERPDMAAILSPPPALATPSDASDQALFRSTRGLKDTPRWALAAHDADAKPRSLLADFGCALGVDLGKAPPPVLDKMLHRVLGDIEVAFRTAKADVKRLRPLVGNDLPICVQRTPRLENTFSYPSGHATRGWTYALILAELAPDHATAILQRGRVYGESRVVCGAHWGSDVEAGRTVGAALVAALHGNAEFRVDLDQARIEIAADRASASVPDAGACRAEAEAVATPIR